MYRAMLCRVLAKIFKRLNMVNVAYYIDLRLNKQVRLPDTFQFHAGAS